MKTKLTKYHKKSPKKMKTCLKATRNSVRPQGPKDINETLSDAGMRMYYSNHRYMGVLEHKNIACCYAV